MLYPHDEIARDRYFAASLGNSFDRARRDGQEFPEMPLDMQLKLARWSGCYQQVRGDALAPATTARGDGGTVHGGVLAGAQFLITLALAAHTMKFIGRMKADRVLMDWLTRRPRYCKKINRFAMAQNWRKYRGAAHIWASLYVLGRMPAAIDELIAFTSVAERFRFLGEIYVPDSRRRTDSRPARHMEGYRGLSPCSGRIRFFRRGRAFAAIPKRSILLSK